MPGTEYEDGIAGSGDAGASAAEDVWECWEGDFGGFAADRWEGNWWLGRRAMVFKSAAIVEVDTGAVRVKLKRWRGQKST